MGVQLASILGDTTDGVERTGGTRWRENVRELENYLRRDMRDARVQREKTYTVNGKNHIQRTVPFVSRLVREIATPYRRQVSRTWRTIKPDGTPGEAVTGELLLRLQTLYADADVNKRMKRAHEQRVALHNATLWVWPETDPTKPPVRVVIISPHEQDVELATPMGQDVADVGRWQFRVPLKHDIDSGQVFYGLAEVTKTRAEWISAPPEMQGQGLYAESTANIFGRIPVVMLRGSDPRAGEWWSPCPEDLLDGQRAINHDFTDVGEFSRKQGFGQPVRKGGAPVPTQGNVRELQLGPETAVEVDGDGDFYFASADPKLEGCVMQLRQYLEAVIATNEMSPETLLKAQGLTALAKRLSLIDRDDARAEAVEDLRRAEQQLYDLMRIAANWATQTETFPPLIVTVEYYEPVVPTDPVADSQADTADIAARFTSTARVRARRDGISIDEAKRRIEEDDAYERGRNPQPSDPTVNEPGKADIAKPLDELAPAGVVTEDVAKTALNGAQVSSLLLALEKVTAGTLSGEAARIAIGLSFPDFDPDEIAAMVTAAEATKPPPAPPTPPGFGRPTSTSTSAPADDGVPDEDAEPEA